MPTYSYNGQATYIDHSRGIRVNPGEILETNYFLPSNWTDFILTDPNSPAPITPNTEVITVNGPQSVTVAGYSVLHILNTVAGSELSVKFGNASQTESIILNDERPELEIELGHSISTDTVYFEALAGIPVINVYLGFSTS